MLLEDKTIIITGASSGIGAAAAILFAAEGANVVLGARRQPLLNDIVERVRASGGQAVALAGDVCDDLYCAALVETSQREFGQLDGAFNNAGIVGELAPVSGMPLDSWETVISTNLTSAFLCAKHQIPAMVQSGGGAIVFTSSFVGVANAGLAGMGAYAASKAGLVGLMRSLASDHAADGVRVNALMPGGTKTPMAGDDRAFQEYVAGLHPMGRIASPDEIAQAAAFLLSDRASFVTGSALAADGGVSIRFG